MVEKFSRDRSEGPADGPRFVRESLIRVVKLKKGTRGMSWRRKAKKGVEGCEKPGRAVKQA